jgi:C1A family cysteine protease
MSGVFISYRRDDSAGHAGRLYDHLKRAFGIDGVFMDLDNIGRGDTFAETLTAKLRESDVLIAVVGRRWLTLTDAAGQRRLDNPDDWVREEIRTALTAGHLVIPLRVDGAALPAPSDLPEDIRGLMARQWAEVRDGSSFENDVEDLTRDIRRRRAKGTWTEWLRSHRISAAAVLVMALATGGYSAFSYARANRVPMPLVSGQSLERATEALAAVGLRAGEISRRQTNEQGPGWVLDQGTPAQTLVSRGTAVALTVAAPKAVDLTPYVTVRDVGASGTVAAAACATAMSAALALQGRPRELSMRYLYARSQRVEESTGEGAYLETVFYVAQQYGAPPESDWPYDWRDARLPPGRTLRDLDQAAGAYKARIARLANIDAVLGALARGTPVVMGARVTDAWDSPKNGVIVPGTDSSRDVLTAVTIVAYDPETRRFKFANSWGTGWADNGFAYFSRDDADRLLAEDVGLWSVEMLRSP